jgi:non-homologous end joining protein Ku
MPFLRSGSSHSTLDEGEVPYAVGSDVIELVANVSGEDVPSEWIDKTYLARPTDATHDAAYILMSHYLRSNGRVFIGKTVTQGTTKVLAVRWSKVYECLVTQTLAYHAQVRWENVDAVRTAVARMPVPAPAMATMAEQVFNGIPNDFDWDEVEDEYGIALEAAIRDKAATGTVTQTTPAPEPAMNHDSLMAALEASLAASGFAHPHRRPRDRG